MNENLLRLFDFLVKDYGLKFDFRESDLIHGRGHVYDYSWYNETGAFTIQYFLEKEELSFYSGKQFFKEKAIRVYDVEKAIWDKHRKWFLCFNYPFFWDNPDRILPALAEVIKAQIDENDEFFGVKIIK